MLELSVIGIFGGFLALLSLGYNLKSAPLANALLITVILPMTIACAQFYTYASGLIRQFPYFYRIPAPLYLLIFPAAYLYVRTFIQDRYRLRRKDYLHALPAVLNVIQMIPYYLLPAQQKRQVVEEVLANTERIVQFREGGLPPYLQFAIIAVQGLIYCACMYRLILNTQIPPGSRLAWVGRRWLLNFTSFLMVIVTALSVSFFVPVPWEISKVDWWIMSVMGAIIMTTTYLFLRPDILYGVPQIRAGFGNRGAFDDYTDAERHSKITPEGEPLGRGMADRVSTHENNLPPAGQHAPKPGITEGDFGYLRVYIPVVEDHFHTQKPYLNKGYTIGDLADEIGVPMHHLSALFNKVYGIRFNDFVNSYRLQYLEEHLHTPAFRNFTQEGLAWEAGFSSRISFFNALKKLRGITPSKFLTKHEQSPDTTRL